MVHCALSDDHMLQLKVVTGTLMSQKCQDQILETGVRPPLDSLDDQSMVLRDDIASLLPDLLPDLNPIEHVWDKLG